MYDEFETSQEKATIIPGLSKCELIHTWTGVGEERAGHTRFSAKMLDQAIFLAIRGLGK